mmetsp:Transcript_43943/g.76139  ORF Transcript_43943/g.76139 Transcript_43943/m.76139 type:complete len:925 (+) Transcript_43943:58-2832(+)
MSHQVHMPTCSPQVHHMGEFAQAQPDPSWQLMPNHVSGAPGDIQPWGADNDKQGFTSSMPPNAASSSQPADFNTSHQAPSEDPQPGPLEYQGADQDTLSQEISAQVARFLAGDGSMSEDDEEDDFDRSMEVTQKASGSGEQPLHSEASEAPNQIHPTADPQASTALVETTPSPVHTAPTEPPKLAPPQPPAELANAALSHTGAAQEELQAPAEEKMMNGKVPSRLPAQDQLPPSQAGLHSHAQVQAQAQQEAQVQQKTAAEAIEAAALAAEAQKALALNVQAVLARSLETKKKVFLAKKKPEEQIMARQPQGLPQLEQPQQQQPLSSQQSQAMSQQVTAAQQAMSQQAQQAQMQQFMQLHQWYGQSGATQVQGSLAMSSPMQCPPAHGTGKYGFSMQSGGSGVANMYEQDFNAATPQTGASATTPCLQSCQRGYWVGEIMRLWKLPPDLDQGGLNSAYEQLQYSLEFLYAQGLTPTLSNIQQHMTEMGVKRLIKDNIMQIAAYRREVFTLWIPANFKACILLTERPFADATLPDYSPFLVESMISEQELAFRKSLTDFLPQMVSHYYSMHNNVSDFRFDAAASSASHESPSAARASEAEEVCPRCLRYRQNCVCVVVAVPPPPAPEAVPGQLRVALSQELAKPDSAKVGTPPVMDVEEGQDPDLFEGNPAVFNNKECTNAAKRLAAIIDAKQSTTLMIRNIPKNVKQKRLLKEVDGSGFADLYDFCYLPSSFGKGYEAQGMGYAFVNFEKVSSGMEFALAWHGSRRFNMIKSDTPLTISCAEFQGKEANASRWSRKGCRVRNPDLRPFIKGPCDILEGDVRAEDKETEKNDKEDAAGSMNVQVLPAGQCGSGFCGMPPPGLPIPQFAQVGPLPSALQPPPGLAAPDVAETFAAQAASIQALNLASRLAAAKPQAVQACVDYLSN